MFNCFGLCVTANRATPTTVIAFCHALCGRLVLCHRGAVKYHHMTSVHSFPSGFNLMTRCCPGPSFTTNKKYLFEKLQFKNEWSKIFFLCICTFVFINAACKYTHLFSDSVYWTWSEKYMWKILQNLTNKFIRNDPYFAQLLHWVLMLSTCRCLRSDISLGGLLTVFWFNEWFNWERN